MRTKRWLPASLTLLPLLLGACSLGSPSTVTPRPSPTSAVAGVQTPSPVVTVEGVVTVTTGSCPCLTLHLTSLSGAPLGAAALPSGLAPPLAAGAGGGYFVSGNLMMRVGSGGSPSQVGTVAGALSQSEASPSQEAELGSLSVAPSGAEWAFLQSRGSGAAQDQEVWLGGSGENPRLLVSTTEDSSVPSSEFPGGWSYQLLGWARGYLVLGQVPAGAGSFLSSLVEVFLVNPETGALTLVSNSESCPVSAVAPSGEYACFQQGGGKATELVTGAEGISSQSWALPSALGYGAAVFSPSGGQILFSLCPGCGNSPSSADLHSQMEVLDTATGSVQPVGSTGLVSDAWLPGGEIVATHYTQAARARAGAVPLSEVVLVDASTGALTALTSDPTSEFVGIATG